MTTIHAEISAAPHLPYALREHQGSNTIAEFMSIVSGASEVEFIEENGELFLVSRAR